MKALHRPDLFCWSRFDEARDVDFHGYAWIRPEGNVLVDPLPLGPHDRAHLERLGGARWIVVTNADHVRGTSEIAAWTRASIAAPAAERGLIRLDVARWLDEGDEVVPGLRVLALHGSKTPGELALLLEGTTLLCGDLVRSHAGGRLDALPALKLADPVRAYESIARLAALPGIEAVLVGDGWPAFRDGGKLLRELCDRLKRSAA
ncbi:MAG: MBL fold metallo-hydrolase [Myxococcota bacterium]|nr:MBL fold metallo-hydrolase [Myxococcota bacterium]MDW8362958.1 MBL fold metallo-hydrolase [Myxococcales bacterium]